MIILGIDPGTLVTGYGILEGDGNTCTAVHFDAVKNSASDPMPDRLKRIFDSLCGAIDRYHPDHLAIETAFYGKNAQSALKIGQARGVAILAGVNYGIPIAEYSPREVKKAIVGNGAASKEQVQSMVKRMLHLRQTPRMFDVSDALAVALCHHFRLTTQRLPREPKVGKYRDWKSFVEANPQRIVKTK
ncbi:MAG: crossover junction endodeoxyribonuclease RuvC [Ignavibacteria bacterium]|nr:crossover junction endodeoxyribonuclease RuvC [Ignavibacteria bacterium]